MLRRRAEDNPNNKSVGGSYRYAETYILPPTFHAYRILSGANYEVKAITEKYKFMPPGA